MELIFSDFSFGVTPLIKIKKIKKENQKNQKESVQSVCH